MKTWRREVRGLVLWYGLNAMDDKAMFWIQRKGHDKPIVLQYDVGAPDASVEASLEDARQLVILEAARIAGDDATAWDQVVASMSRRFPLTPTLLRKLCMEVPGVEHVSLAENFKRATVTATIIGPADLNLERLCEQVADLRALGQTVEISHVAEGSHAINTMGAVPENLEMIAHNQLWRREHMQLLRMLPTVSAQSINHEYDRVNEYVVWPGDINED